MRDRLSVIIHFPVDPHVYKYLQKSVGEKLVASKNIFFGNLVLDILSKIDHDINVVKGDLVYTVEISEDYMNRYGIFVNEKITRKFNSYVDKMFRKEMITYIDIQKARAPRQKEAALKEFLSYYSVTEEDINYETLVKYIGRTLPKNN